MISNLNRQVVDNFETGGRRHCIKHVCGTAGKEMRYRRPEASSAPTSATDIRGCLQYRPLGRTFDELGPEVCETGTSFDKLVLTSEAESLVEEARRWKQSEEWYASRGIPWRRGWLLYGHPGTGKTALTRAVAEDLDLPVFVFDLASMYNSELQTEWSKMLAQVPCMALIEDIDAVFDKRRNIAQRDKQCLTFDCLLNCLDGIEKSNGLFVVITTNRPEKIDEALGGQSGGVGSTRPGRVDRVLEMPLLDEVGRRKMASQILAEWPGEWERLVRDGTGDSGAQFQERCSRRALHLHYREVAGGHDVASRSRKQVELSVK